MRTCLVDNKRIARRLAQQQVKTKIAIEQCIGMPGERSLTHAIDCGLESRNVRSDRRRKPRSEPLECAAHLVELQNVALGKVHDAGASTRSLGNKAFHCQKVDRFANGALSDPETGSPLAFHDPLPGKQASVDDLSTQQISQTMFD